jgi:hypothetical protein
MFAVTGYHAGMEANHFHVSPLVRASFYGCPFFVVREWIWWRRIFVLIVVAFEAKTPPSLPFSGEERLNSDITTSHLTKAASCQVIGYPPEKGELEGVWVCCE